MLVRHVSLRAACLRASPIVAIVASSCGGRTPLLETRDPDEDAAGLDAAVLDAASDAPVREVSVVDVFQPDVDAFDRTPPPPPPVSGPDAGMCDLGLNTEYPTVTCGAESGIWFAARYSPSADIAIDRIEAHMTSGSVDVLSATGENRPGAPLFQGPLTKGSTHEWYGVNLSPRLKLWAGQRYFLAFRNGCSMSAGKEMTEFISGSLDGPWRISGTDVWTAHVLGICAASP